MDLRSAEDLKMRLTHSKLESENGNEKEKLISRSISLLFGQRERELNGNLFSFLSRRNAKPAVISTEVAR